MYGVTDGKLLLTANNAEDPPFATLFTANGNVSTSTVAIITKITIDPTIVPPGSGLAIEQSAWEPPTARFYVSVPLIANNPPGCNYGQLAGPITCQGGMLVVDPTTLSTPTAVIGAFNPATNTGVVPLNQCAPNGATVGPHANLLLGCTPGNSPSDTSTLVINAKTKHFLNGCVAVYADRRSLPRRSRLLGVAAAALALAVLYPASRGLLTNPVSALYGW